MADATRSDPPPLVLGQGMSARTRPRLGTSSRRHRPAAIGIVGRSSIGFGRVIATAGSSRPSVTTANLTTNSLRPPFPAWYSQPGAAVDEPPVARPSWTTQLVPPARSARPAPAPAVPAAATPRPRPAPPSKVDALRRLLESRGMIEPSADPNAAGPAVAEPATTPVRAEPTPAEPTPAERATAPGDRTATPAGPTTAPGQFGRRVRPEAAPAEERLAGVFRDPTSSPAERSPARPTDPMHRFRAALEARGMVAPGRSGADAGDGAGRDVVPTRRSPRQPAAPAARRHLDRDDDAERAPGTPTRQGPTEASPAPATRLPLSLLPELGRRPSRLPAATRTPVTSTRDTTTAADSSIGAAVRPEVATLVAEHRPTDERGDGWARAARPDAPARDDRSPGSTIRRTPAREQPEPARSTPIPSAPDGATRPGAQVPRRSAEPAARAVAAAPGRPADVVVPARTTGGQPELDRADATALHLRSTAHRIGLPHSQSDLRRPRTALVDRIRRRDDLDAVRPAALPFTARDGATGSIAARTAESVQPSLLGLGPAPSSPAPHPSRPTPGRTSPDVVARAGDDTPPTLRRPGSLGIRLARADAPTPASGRRSSPTPVASPTALQRALATGDTRRDPAPAASAEPTSLSDVGVTSAPVRRSRDRSIDAVSASPAAADPTSSAANTAVVSSTAAAAVAPPPIAPTPAALAERFLHELRRDPAGPPRALPEPYRPLASAITGTASNVRISHDAASSRALRAVGKRAATVGDVIHLQRAPEHDARADEILAHELTHVAHASPVPRFFDDDARGPEERLAEQVAAVISRSPVMPSAPAPTRQAEVIRRSPTSTARPSTSGAISAEALAASIEGRAAPSLQRRATAPAAAASQQQRTDTVRRSPAESTDGRQDAVRRTLDDDSPTASGGWPFQTEQEELEWFERMVSRSGDYILRRIEERLLIDLERRGGRFWRDLS